jgi:hypothetical protein
MFGRQRDRARRRERERADAELISELRWQWRGACGNTALAQMIYTPSGATRAVPTIDHIELGPPIALTVRVRPGLSVTDFVTAAPALARALNVTEIEVHPLVSREWVRIVLLTTAHAAVPYRPWEPDVAAMSVGA